MKPDRFHSPHARMATLIIMLVIAWLLWSGLFKPLLLALGLFSCALTFLLVRRMGYFDNDFFALRLSFKLLSYWAWLAREVYRSSLGVARVVLDPSLPISPRTIEIKSNSGHLVDQVILANSITLTPGTLALDLHKGIIKVHTLTEAGAQDLLAGEMNRRVGALRDG
jgi:multicomponent Na+:H+ antiporter subunit E